MRTCPACGKENPDDVARCVTCDEELEATSSTASTMTEKAVDVAPPVAEEKHDTLDSELKAHQLPTHTEHEGEAPPASVAVAEDKSASKPPGGLLSEDTKHAMDDGKDSVKEEPPHSNGSPGTVPSEAAHVENEPHAARPTVAIPDSAPPKVVEAPSEQRGPQHTALVEAPRATSADSMQPGGIKLVVEQGMSVNKEYLLNDPELIVGRRDPEQEFIPDIDLFDQENANNRYISRRQARIYFQDGHLYVEDLDSSNGTCVNNRPIKPNISVQLHAGDKLLFGQSVMFRIRLMAN